MNSLLTLLVAFTITVLIECGLAALFNAKRLVYVVFLCNLLTNPVLNFVLVLYFGYIGYNGYWLLFACLEIGVLFVEAAIIKWIMEYSYRKAAALSLLFNGSSFLVALLWLILHNTINTAG